MTGPQEASRDRRPARTNWPHDVPSAVELVEAVREFLGDDLIERVGGRDRWLVRIATNALSIAERELRLGPDHAKAHLARLEVLGFSTDAELGAAIRSGALDERTDEVRSSITATALDKLAVANPRYVLPQDRTPADQPRSDGRMGSEPASEGM